MPTAALPVVNPLRRSLSEIDPLRYPGRRLSYDVLLLAGQELRLRLDDRDALGAAVVTDTSHEELGTLDQTLAANGEAQIAQRTPVLAVGANADPQVLARKLDRGHAKSAVPLVRASVTGLRIGHSAHVSRGGYIPWTPVRAPDASIASAVLLLDETQLRALDTSEPNYDGVALPPAQFRVRLESTGRRLDSCRAYASRWGALYEGADLIEPTRQHRLFARLVRIDPEFGRLTAGLTPQQVTRLLAVEDLQEYLRGHWQRSGFSRSCELGAPIVPPSA